MTSITPSDHFKRFIVSSSRRHTFFIFPFTHISFWLSAFTLFILHENVLFFFVFFNLFNYFNNSKGNLSASCFSYTTGWNFHNISDWVDRAADQYHWFIYINILTFETKMSSQYSVWNKPNRTVTRTKCWQLPFLQTTVQISTCLCQIRRWSRWWWSYAPDSYQYNSHSSRLHLNIKCQTIFYIF